MIKIKIDTNKLLAFDRREIDIIPRAQTGLIPFNYILAGSFAHAMRYGKEFIEIVSRVAFCAQVEYSVARDYIMSECDKTPYSAIVTAKHILDRVKQTGRLE